MARRRRQRRIEGPTAVVLLTLSLDLENYRAAADKFCGVNIDDAKSACWQPCTTDSDCCASSQICYETGSSCGSSNLGGTQHYYCGISWCEAAYKCGAPCPDLVCPEGESCFADVPCNSESPRESPPLPDPPTSSPYQFCGSSMTDAKSHCWQPCPRGESDCCLGLQCIDTSSNDQGGGSCTNSDYSGSDHYFCGSSWCNAAYSCQMGCPGGTNEECPEGQYCYADVPCTMEKSPPNVQTPSNIFSKYCGNSADDAAGNCWQPCRNNDDCCYNQTCYAGVSTCPYPDSIGSDHFFCGPDFCGASYECSNPCPTGYDAECPDGQRCFSNTPCNANIRSMTETFLRYGLPRSAHLVRQISKDEVKEQDDTASTASNDSIAVGIIFGICLVVVVASNIAFLRLRRTDSL